ncbi:chemotaxis protein MotB [Oceanisphaera litoralis]|uniref:OmpA family protein n=1 Tax=Oceanisphaera litoralis TaxID=225144 RepID=UPI00195A4BEF|nr:OmpA family protein [Oceanisphaera litoralis]MBM7456585.1 chemotaxis protein MotB [Oceanisphaera litoralis]
MRRRSLVSGSYSAGLDRWLVSYADYMTLVFALFVVLYSIHAGKTELQQPMLDGMQQALVRLSGDALPATAAISRMALASESAATGTGAPLDDSSLARLQAELELRLAPLLERRLVELENDGDWLTLNFDGSLLFASGSALPGANAQPVLSALIPVLAPVNHFVRVRGYADNLPVSNELYASNWQLSAERARGVLEWLLQEGIAAPRLALEAFGEFHPRDQEPGERGRARNRRVEIAISAHRWQPGTALPSRPLNTEQSPILRVYELPGGGIRIGTTATQGGAKQ